jgi:hypothetical protein
METIEMTKEQLWKRPHHGWEIRYNPPPIPVRSFDWIAIHPNYECWMEDGDWQHNGMCLHAPNKSELMQAIIDWETEND